MCFDLAILFFYLSLVVMFIGFVVVVIAWVKDYEKVERTGIRIALLGVLLAMLSVSSCTIGLFTINSHH